MQTNTKIKYKGANIIQNKITDKETLNRMQKYNKYKFNFSIKFYFSTGGGGLTFSDFSAGLKKLTLAVTGVDEVEEEAAAAVAAVWLLEAVVKEFGE